MSHRPWRQPPWFVTFQAKLCFVREAQQAVDGPVTVRKPSTNHRGGFAMGFTIAPPATGQRTVHVEFSLDSPDVPRVFVDGPNASPHRYQDGSLCMWYPEDPPELCWQRRDGAAVLVGCIALHLVREEWWRASGEWIGPEAPHSVQPSICGGGTRA